MYVESKGHVTRAKEPVKCERAFPSLGGYTLVFSNQGKLRKFNPTPVNYKLGAWRPFRQCLVSGCGKPTKNKWGLCAGTNHQHWAEVKTRRGRKTEVKWDWVGMTRIDHIVDWKGVLKQDGTTKEISAPEHAGIAKVLLDWVGDSPERGVRVDAFVRDALKVLIVGKVEDSTTMQLLFEAGRDPAGDLVKRIHRAVEEHFQGVEDVVDWSREQGGIFESIPVKAVAGLMALAFAAEEANRNDLWFIKEVLGRSEEESDYASAYMSAVYFLVRQAGATHKQAQMSQRTM